MKNFKTIAVFVLAEQWLGTVEQNEKLLSDGVIMESAARDGSVLVPTIEGNLTCRLNDYIVKDANTGRVSVCDSETFESAFEFASEVEEVERVEAVPVTEVVEEVVNRAVIESGDETVSMASEEVAEKIEPTAQDYVTTDAGAEVK